MNTALSLHGASDGVSLQTKKSTTSTATSTTTTCQTCACYPSAITNWSTTRKSEDSERKCSACNKNCGKPALLDAFSGAGGAARGYQLAGFCVLGVDVKPQPHYAGCRHHVGDAFDFIREHGHEFSAIHCSPPCQSFTAYRRKGHGVGDGYPDLIPETRAALQATGRPYVIENVPGAPLQSPILLCGSMFGLDVRRHRLFEASWLMSSSIACQHQRQWPRFMPAANRTNLRSTVEVGVWRIPLDVQQRAMGGLDWMTREELSQAVPPAYTQFIGERLTGYLAALEAAHA